MKYPIVVICLLLLFTLGACQQISDAKKKDAALQDSITMCGGLDGELIVGNFVTNYKGTIDNQYPISVELIKVDHSIGGSYHYDGKTTSLKLKGNMEDTGELRISELNSEGEETGFFEGKMEGEKITGTWYNKKRTKSIPFSLTQTSIASLQSKSDMLSDAMGTFALNSIAGSMGADALFDTYLENGKWISSSSGITSGVAAGMVCRESLSVVG